MGRDTSIKILDKKSKTKIDDLELQLETEFDEFEYRLLSAKINALYEKLETIKVKYWGKSDCSDVVSFFRKFKDDDGDIVITDEIFSEMKIHLSEKLSASEFRIIEKICFYINC